MKSESSVTKSLWDGTLQIRCRAGELGGVQGGLVDAMAPAPIELSHEIANRSEIQELHMVINQLTL